MVLALRLSDDDIRAGRERFARARALVDAGQLEEARRIWWWPSTEAFPKCHWTEVPVRECVCRWKTPEGSLGLCFDCKGATLVTSALIPRLPGV